MNLIFKFSTKRLIAERNLRKIEKKLDREPGNQKCFFYQSERKSEYHHLIPKSQGFEWIDRKDNLLPVGRTAHNILHSGCNEEIRMLPRFEEYLEKMEKLDKKYYNRYLLKLIK